MILIGIVVAYWAGMRWRHNTLAWQTHRVQAGREKDARAAKWTTFWAVIVSTAILVGYMLIVTHERSATMHLARIHRSDRLRIRRACTHRRRIDSPRPPSPVRRLGHLSTFRRGGCRPHGGT